MTLCGFFLQIPLCIKLKHAYGDSIDFLMSLTLLYQQLVSWTNEYVNGWLQINDIAISLKVCPFLFKWGSIKPDVLRFSPQVLKKWSNCPSKLVFPPSVTGLLLRKHPHILKISLTKRLGVQSYLAGALTLDPQLRRSACSVNAGAHHSTPESALPC